jgi:outer membrane lipoprotein-sorting protein
MIVRRKALICSSLALLIVAACRAQNGSPATNNTSSDTVVSTTPPFQTKEPERYRATRTITNVTADGKTNVIKHSIAKDGELRRFEAEFASKKTIILDLPEGKLVLLPDEKVYADQSGGPPPGSSDQDESSPERLLHTEIGNSSYQKLGTESIAGRNTQKYRVVVNDSNAPSVSSSETLIWIDEALGMIIRSETKSSDGSRSTMDLSGITLEVDKNLFQVPGGYKKISPVEMLSYLAKA